MGLALQEKHVTEVNRRFEKLLRGDVIEVAGGEPRGDGVALGPESRVRIVAAAGRPVPPGTPSGSPPSGPAGESSPNGNLPSGPAGESAPSGNLPSPPPGERAG
jgi:hypothetical protein